MRRVTVPKIDKLGQMIVKKAREQKGKNTMEKLTFMERSAKMKRELRRRSHTQKHEEKDK